MRKIIKDIPLFVEVCRKIAELREEGLSCKEMNRVLGLVDYSPTSSYRIMRSAAYRHLIVNGGK